jgi:threonine dehydrogenase-like Zn-dependent dehydrogenase
MKALCYSGVNKLKVETVSDPEILNPKDVIVKVVYSSVSGIDLHFLHGYIPGMKVGDILGHEFVGEIVETGAEVKNLQKGDRVVVAPVIGCGTCFYCKNEQWSLCDNSNHESYLQDKLIGHSTAGIFGGSHLYGGYSGSHAEFIRVPYADSGCFKIPDQLSYEQALFASDSIPTGYMAADMTVKPGDIVAVWGAGAVGQMAMAAAKLKGASRVIAIDRHDFRLSLAAKNHHVEALNFKDTDVLEVLKEGTGGRGPDVCIDAVGMEAKSSGLEELYDKTKQAVNLQSDKPSVIRQAIMACRKGGTVGIAGLYSGNVDKFPLGVMINKALTVKSGLVHAQKYIPSMLEHIEKGEIDPTYLKTHEWTLEQGNDGYRQFAEDQNSILRGVFALGVSTEIEPLITQEYEQ